MACCYLKDFAILLIHLWLSSPVTSDTNEGKPVCIPSIMVTRNTVWIVRPMHPLKINCTIETESHCWTNVTVLWCQVQHDSQCKPLTHTNFISTEWINVTESKRLLFLVFRNVSMQDDGLYRCELKSPITTVSHSVNVTVTDYVPDDKTINTVISRENNTINSTNVGGDHNSWPEFNVYIYSGIGVLLLIVVVVCVIVILCRGKKKSLAEKIHENQPIAAPVADFPLPTYKSRESPHIKARTLPSQPPPVYDIPPVRVGSLRDHSSAGRHPVNRGPPRQCRDRGAVEEIEEENPLIYASLNHNTMPQRPQRIAHLQIEASEYAAIKVT
ncbi:B- and T-lymphocyte attenuator-like [Silurus meridionalis]|uniref:Ig-like domain-containing protein n=1 Tax=Silurus meridionalis TaxID=175797 RepID=A0A8T0ADF8_SILME|nr:B- and T-lymphocyte attenuator-like [Silurus meridionalis]KAF7689403.1 hypothetical protein HF521_012756 [Silurus meridionalis]